MAMKITERLKAEHGVFLYQLAHLERLVREGAPSQVLKAVVETIASAEEHHAEIEDQLLFPALVKAIGREAPLLRKSEEEHGEVKRLAGLIHAGSFDDVIVARFVEVMRKHLEREIHDVFTLVEDMIPADTLVSMSNWDVDHLYETNAVPKPWSGKRGR